MVIPVIPVEVSLNAMLRGLQLASLISQVCHLCGHLLDHLRQLIKSILLCIAQLHHFILEKDRLCCWLVLLSRKKFGALVGIGALEATVNMLSSIRAIDNEAWEALDSWFFLLEELGVIVALGS